MIVSLLVSLLVVGVAEAGTTVLAGAGKAAAGGAGAVAAVGVIADRIITVADRIVTA